VLRFRQPEGNGDAAVDGAGDEGLALRLRAEVTERQGGWKIADDAVLVLQVAVQSKAPRGEVLADHGHLQVAGVAAAVRERQRQGEETRLPGAPAGLGEQRLPGRAGPAVAGPVRARVFAAMIEEAAVVALVFEGAEFRVDKAVDGREQAARRSL
jgi:hypothetical protein